MNFLFINVIGIEKRKKIMFRVTWIVMSKSVNSWIKRQQKIAENRKY